MKPIPYCVPDLLRTVLDTARLVSDDAFIHRKVLMKVMSTLTEAGDLGTSGPELMRQCLAAAYKALGVKDPYAKEKARRNKAMLGLEASFRAYLDVAPDRLSACLNLALAGYAPSDMNILGRADIERAILEHLDVVRARDERQELVRALNRAETVLYVLDGAGEIVLDKLLIEEIGKGRTVTAVVAARPVLTLATRADAEAVGLSEVATVTDAGAPMLGLSLERASKDFRQPFADADVVLAKGETHYETLRHAEREIFFLLQATCEDVAARLDVQPGEEVLVRHPGAVPVGAGDANSPQTS